MTWVVTWSSRARRDMAALPAKVAGAVLTYVDERLALNPMRLSKPLRGELEGVRSARNGDYRVLFDLDDSRTTIVVMRMQHRAHVYRRP